MFFHYIGYVAFVGFAYIGLSRLLRYRDKAQLWTVAVGVFGILAFAFNDFARAIFNTSPAQLILFDRISQVLDALGAISVVILVIWEWSRK
jgi:hypothetical protein